MKAYDLGVLRATLKSDWIGRLQNRLQRKNTEEREPEAPGRHEALQVECLKVDLNTSRREAATWEQLALAADAEQRSLEEQVGALKAQVEQLHRKLDLSALQLEAPPKSAARLPRVLVVGGPNRRGETLAEARKRLNVEFDFVPSEREKGRTQGAMKSLRTRAANASAVLVVTDCCGHDKRNVAVETCRQRGVPFREIKTLSTRHLREAVGALLPC